MMCLFLVLACATGMTGQGSGSGAAAPQSNPPAAQQAQQPAATISAVVDKQLTLVEKEFVDAAEAMPEDKFNFTPESLNLKGSDYKGVRTFALEVKHVATANYAFFSPLTGDAMPASIKGPNGPDELKTKAEIIKFLKDSFALGHKAAATLTAENAVEGVQFRQNKAPRLYLATFAVAHAFDHYGQMVEYLRMNGIIPPASRGN
jgi:uncharacterized damage-inducible protein DinB